MRKRRKNQGKDLVKRSRNRMKMVLQMRREMKRTKWNRATRKTKMKRQKSQKNLQKM